MDTINSDLIYKKKYLKYKNKYINEKNKLYGGLTLKNGLYAFFCNENYAKTQGIICEPNKDAPSIYDINKKLSLNGYRLENNSKEIKLIIAADYLKSAASAAKDFIVDPLVFVGKVVGEIAIISLKIAFSPILILGNVMSGGGEDIQSGGNKSLPAIIPFTESWDLGNKKDLKEEKIKKLLIFMSGEKDVNNKDDIRPYILNNNNRIDCCIIIEVNRLLKNKYIKIFKKS